MASNRYDDILEPLTPAQFQELKSVKEDPFEFSKKINVIHPIKGKVKFNLYPIKRKFYGIFLTTGLISFSNLDKQESRNLFRCIVYGLQCLIPIRRL